ncbi:potassium/sodium hyperpolarization-activated cyclic nucleotide-gated channel 1-like [Anthonomus grandis grandis]|uniref:potassium/sodium hyperpolarization-activated cyclic nucleotide-gated channel 1-like n=1 Tax=Anthonomus grandis grandis TaxID=2921223 RepID=UPI00216621CD|nr:potassium/sodium hyperpolarization-activated cyclic nucleotide-gated channel 1-like [Anthonomus grandis grandis]
MPPNPNVHYCELKRDTFGLPKLPPNAPWHQKFARSIRKCLTLNPNSTTSKRFFRNRSTMIGEQKRHLKGATFIIHPFSTFNRIRQVIFVILWTLEMLLTPVYISFIHISQSHHVHNQHNEDAFLASVTGNYFISSIYRHIISPLEVVVVLLFFITGYINIKTKEIVIDPKQIVKRYLATYFITDFLMIIKFGIYVQHSVYLYLLNLACLFRGITLFEYLKDIILSFKVKEEVYDCIRLFLISMILLNGLNCMFYYLPWMLGHLSFPKHSWPYRSHITPNDKDFTVGKAYVDSMVVVMSYFVGAGDLSAKTYLNDVLQKAMLTFIMICGRLWTLYVIASILKLFSVVTISESKYEEYLLQLEVYMTQKRIPKALRARLLEYYRS